jgi:hypothetical protein
MIEILELSNQVRKTFLTKTQDWFEGKVTKDGQAFIGFFPANHVQLITDTPVSIPPPITQPSPAQVSAKEVIHAKRSYKLGTFLIVYLIVLGNPSDQWISYTKTALQFSHYCHSSSSILFT